jgi:hypothetical protein
LRPVTTQKTTIRVVEAGLRAGLAALHACSAGFCAAAAGICDLATGFCANHSLDANRAFLHVLHMFFSFSYISPSP